jgi:hypothetical protein
MSTPRSAEVNAWAASWTPTAYETALDRLRRGGVLSAHEEMSLLYALHQFFPEKTRELCIGLLEGCSVEQLERISYRYELAALLEEARVRAGFRVAGIPPRS